ncbi:MAG: ankyrin repeat domain-containing protein [Deltaproteobacteria bacterium]|nr:ankyrin repeat domain-containing protein [Deltaproteobacteria bacterium]
MSRRLQQPSGSGLRHLALRTLVLAVTAAMLWLALASAQEKPPPNQTGLSALEVWEGAPFRTARADFSGGLEKGLESLGKGLVGMFTPRLEKRLELSPVFRSDVSSYSVRIGYRVTEISILASAVPSGARIEVTGIGPGGVALKPGPRMDGIDISLGDRQLRADVLTSLKDLPVGKSKVTVRVAGGAGDKTRSAELAVVRLDADLKDAEERLLYFRGAAEKGKADALSRAIEAGADVDTVLAFGTQRATALVIAAAMGFGDAVDVAIRAGGDVNGVFHAPGDSADGASALLLAIQKGDERIVRLLLGAGADPNLTLPGPEVHRKYSLAGATPLLLALGRNEYRIARVLIETGADVNRTLPDALAGSDASLSGASPLMLASFLGKADLVDALIEAGADVNHMIPGERRRGGRNPRTAGLTALKAATRQGHTAIADRLKEAGATR